MFTFDIKKHKPKKINNVNGSQKYFCRIRKIHLNITPEEKVRQAFLNFLIDEIKIPERNIEVEKHLFHYNKELNGRIDVLIIDDEGKPLAIYECKSEFEGYTEEVQEQGLKYYDVLVDAWYLGFVIGDCITLYGPNFKSNINELINLNTQPTFNQMLGKYIDNKKEIDKIKFQKFNIFPPFKKSEIDILIDCNNIGENTSTKLYQPIFNLINWLFDGEDILILNNIKDIGIKYTKYGNAAGGSFYNDYRGFFIKNLSSKPTIWITITSMATSENNIGTSLLVAIEESGKRHSSLQLRLDNFLIIKDKSFEIWHDGKITVGKLGSVKKQILIDYIKSKQPNLIIDNKIYLGKFNSEIEIKSENIETKEFISNLIEYALIRDEFREIWKTNTATIRN